MRNKVEWSTRGLVELCRAFSRMTGWFWNIATDDARLGSPNEGYACLVAPRQSPVQLWRNNWGCLIGIYSCGSGGWHAARGEEWSLFVDTRRRYSTVLSYCRSGGTTREVVTPEREYSVCFVRECTKCYSVPHSSYGFVLRGHRDR